MKNYIVVLAIQLAWGGAICGQELVDPKKGSVSPSGKFQAMVAPLIGKNFEYDKALMLVQLASNRIVGLGQNSRTFGISWSPNGEYVAVANNGVSKENEISIFKSDEDTAKIREVATTPVVKNRTVWQIVEWKEDQKKVALSQRSENEPESVVWLQWK